jgi:hypothetical protein
VAGKPAIESKRRGEILEPKWLEPKWLRKFTYHNNDWAPNSSSCWVSNSWSGSGAHFVNVQPRKRNSETLDPWNLLLDCWLLGKLMSNHSCNRKSMIQFGSNLVKISHVPQFNLYILPYITHISHMFNSYYPYEPCITVSGPSDSPSPGTGVWWSWRPKAAEQPNRDSSSNDGDFLSNIMIINVGYQCLSNMFINGYQRFINKHVYNCFSMTIQQKWDQSSRQDDFIQQTIVDPTKVPQKLGSFIQRVQKKHFKRGVFL